MSLTAEQRAIRARRIGASEVGALFGLDPYCTRFELWHRKRGSLPEEDMSDNAHVFWGDVLEPAIARGVALREGWKVRKVRRDAPHPELDCLGATLDYEVVGHEDGRAALEIKTADTWAAKRWADGLPPLRYQLQLQTQLDCTGCKWGAIAVLVGGNDLRVFRFDRHESAIARVRAEVAAFWRSIEAGEEPQPDWHADAETVAQLYGVTSAGSVLDLSDDVRFNELCRAYVAHAAVERQAQAGQAAAKAELLTLIGAAAKVRGHNCRVTTWNVSASEGRKGHRGIRVTVYDDKEEDVL